MKINGINYEIVNSGKSSKTFLFIHGSGCNTKLFHMITKKMQYQSIIIDLPGHGKSEGVPCSSIYEYGEVVENFIKEICDKFNEIIVVGHSMGGCISLLMGLANIPSVKGIVVLNSGAQVQMNSKFLEKLKNNKLDMIYLLKACGNFNNLNLYKTLAKAEKNNVMINDLLTSTTFNVKDRVKDINIPTLIVAGDKDELIPKEAIAFLKDNIKGSELKVLKNTGHLSPAIKSTEVAELLTEFSNKINS